MSEKIDDNDIQLDSQDLIKKIIKDKVYITDINTKPDIDDLQNPLIPLEEATSQLVDSLFASSNMRSQKSILIFRQVSKMISSSGQTRPNQNQIMGSLFRSGCSSYTITDDENELIDEEQLERIKSFPNIEIKNESDLDSLRPPQLLIQSESPSYEELIRKCSYLEKCINSEKKQRQQLTKITSEQQQTIQELQQFEKAAYEQIDIRISQITELEQTVNQLEKQILNIKLNHQEELKKKDEKIEELNKQFLTIGNLSQLKAMLQIKEKQIQLLQGQLSTLRATTQYRSQGSYYSNKSIEKGDKIFINNNNGDNKIIFSNNNINSLIQKTKPSTPKKSQTQNYDSQSTQRSKKGINIQEQQDRVEVQTWLDKLQKKNSEALRNQLDNSKQEQNNISQNLSFTENYNKYVHSYANLTKVSCPAFDRNTAYLTQEEMLINKERN